MNKLLIVFLCLMLPAVASAGSIKDRLRKAREKEVAEETERVLTGKSKKPKKADKKGMPVVDFYVTSWCPYCKKMEKFMKENNIKFRKYDVEKDRNAAKRKRELAGKDAGVPITVYKGNIVRGYYPEGLLEVLEMDN